MKILLIGLYGSDNLGDAVLCDCCKALLQKQFPEAQIVIRDFSDRISFPEPEEVTMEELERNRARLKLCNLVSKWTVWDKQFEHELWWLRKNLSYIDAVCLENCDLAVFGGGQVFMDYLVMFAAAYVQRLSEKHIPIFFNACGTGPSFSRKIRKYTSEMLMNPCVKLISTRDSAQLINQRYLKGEKRAINSYDPALWCPEVYGVRKNPEADTLGLGLMYTNSVSPKAAAKFWLRLIRTLEQQKILWRFFVNGAREDIAFARKIYLQMPELSRPFEECFVPVPREPAELVQTIARFKSLISFRLHSHIIAAALDIPSVAVVWDDKLRFFFESIGHPERCVTVRSRPKAVLERLQQAEMEGYDRLELQRQKSIAGRLLFDAIETTMNEMKAQ